MIVGFCVLEVVVVCVYQWWCVSMVGVGVVGFFFFFLLVVSGGVHGGGVVGRC